MIARQAVPRRVEGPHSCGQILIAPEMRGVLDGIGAKGAGSPAAERVAESREGAERGFLQHILLDADGGESLRRSQSVDAPGAGYQRAEVGLPLAPVQLETGAQRDGGAFQQPDPPAEEGDYVGAE